MLMVISWKVTYLLLLCLYNSRSFNKCGCFWSCTLSTRAEWWSNHCEVTDRFPCSNRGHIATMFGIQGTVYTRSVLGGCGRHGCPISSAGEDCWQHGQRIFQHEAGKLAFHLRNKHLLCLCLCVSLTGNYGSIQLVNAIDDPSPVVRTSKQDEPQFSTLKVVKKGIMHSYLHCCFCRSISIWLWERSYIIYWQENPVTDH